MDKLVWNVMYHDINGKKIDTFNIFAHSGFRDDIKRAAKECKNRDEFAKTLRASLRYYFWSKSEWEIIVSPWTFCEKECSKIDVHDQIMYNWERFLDYVWSERKKL